MKAKLHRLTAAGPILGNKTPNNVTELVSKLQKMSKNGELKALAVAYVDGSDSTMTDWAGGCAQKALTVYAVSMLNHRMHVAADED